MSNRFITIIRDENIDEELPIPPEIIQKSTEKIEELAKEQFECIEELVEIKEGGRRFLRNIIKKLPDEALPVERYAGVDGGIGSPRVTITATYSSVVGIAYSPQRDLPPKIKVTPLRFPPSLEAPLQNYLAVIRQQHEYLVAREIAGHVGLLMLDGSIVPGIFARYLRGAERYDELLPDFIDLFKKTFVNDSENGTGSKCVLQQLLDVENLILVGIPKRVKSRHILNTRLTHLSLPPHVSDIMVLSLLLEPGEYVRPTPYRDVILNQYDANRRDLAKLHWEAITSDLESVEKNQKYGLDDIVDTIPWMARNTWVTYFKPSRESPALRIEVLSGDKDKLPHVLATIRKDFYKVSNLPFALYMADQLAKQVAHFPALLKNLVEDKVYELSLQKHVKDSSTLWFMNQAFKDVEWEL